MLKSAGRHFSDFNKARGSSRELLFGMNTAFMLSHLKPSQFFVKCNLMIFAISELFAIVENTERRVLKFCTVKCLVMMDGIFLFQY